MKLESVFAQFYVIFSLNVGFKEAVRAEILAIKFNHF